MLLRRELPLYSLLLTMELLGGYAALVAIGAPRMTAVGYGVFWLLLAASMAAGAVALLVASAPLPDRVARAVLLSVGAGVCVTLTVVVAGGRNSIVTTAVLLAVAFWRGIVVTQDSPSHDEVQRRFGYGFGLLFLGIVWIIVWGVALDHAMWRILAVVGIAYTLVGLVALAAARLEEGRDAAVGPAVFLSVATLVGSLLVVALIALQIFAVDIVGWAAQGLEPVSGAIGGILRPVIQFVLSPIIWLAGVIHQHATPPHPHGQPLQNRRPRRHPVRHTDVPGLPPAIEFFVLAVLLGGLVFVLWRLMPRPQRHKHHRTAAVEETRRTLVGPSDWWSMLLSWIRRRFARGSAVTATRAQNVMKHVIGPSYPTDPVRRAYGRVLQRAERAGERRHDSVTPLEFEKQLRARWPVGSNDFASLTRAYILRRYGETEPSSGEGVEAEEYWHRLRAVMRE